VKGKGVEGADRNDDLSSSFSFFFFLPFAQSEKVCSPRCFRVSIQDREVQRGVALNVPDVDASAEVLEDLFNFKLKKRKRKQKEKTESTFQQ
jgi:hypothetical protein